MSYAEIKQEIEQKTRLLMDENLPEKKKEAINIDLERVLLTPSIFHFLYSSSTYRLEL